MKIGVTALAALALASPASGAVIIGTNGSDRLIGTGQADQIYGMRGADYLDGKGGRDRLDGGRGADRFYAIGAGRDRIFCGDGIDRVKASPNDQLNDCENVRIGGVGRVVPLEVFDNEPVYWVST